MMGGCFLVNNAEHIDNQEENRINYYVLPWYYLRKKIMIICIATYYKKIK